MEFFNSIFNDFSGMVDSIEQIMTGLMILSIIPMLVNCFFGYKLKKLTITLTGALWGAVIGLILGIISRDQAIMIALTVILALLCGFIAFKLYKLGLFLQCWLLGTIVFAALFIILGHHDAIGFSVIIGFIVGVLALVLHKGYIIATTAISGGFSAGNGIGFAIGNPVGGIVIGLVLSVAGIIVQVLLEKKKPKDKTAVHTTGAANTEQAFTPAPEANTSCGAVGSMADTEATPSSEKQSTYQNNSQTAPVNSEVKKQKKLPDAKKTKKLLTIAGCAAACILILFGAIKLFTSLPPSTGRMKADAKDCMALEFGSEYKITRISIEKEKYHDSRHATATIKATHRENKDILEVELGIDYDKIKNKYEKTDHSIYERTVYPDHNISMLDKFPMCAVTLDFGSDSTYLSEEELQELIASGELKLEFAPNYKKAELDKESCIAVVPVEINAQYLNASASTEAELEYLYRGDYTWSCITPLRITMTAKGNELSTQQIKDMISDARIEHLGETLPGKYLSLENYNIEYAEGFTGASLESNFTWDNSAVKFSGYVIASFELSDGTWSLSDIRFNSCTEPERYKDISSKELNSILEQVIAEHCDENTNVSDLTVIETGKTDDGMQVTAQYTSEGGLFILRNTITVLLRDSIMDGYTYSAFKEEKIVSTELSEAVHMEFEIGYKLACGNARPTQIPSSGVTTLILDIDTDCFATVSCKFGQTELYLVGELEYPNNRLALDPSRMSINVDYDHIFSNLNNDINFEVKPSLYYNDALTGSIEFTTKDLVVDNFSIIIE